MYKAKAIITHEISDTCYIYSEKQFDTEQTANEWISSMDGFMFAQEVMVGLDVLERFEGYRLEGVMPEKVEA